VSAFSSTKEHSLIVSLSLNNEIVGFDPAGNHLKDILFSGKNLTCPTWGGKDLDFLFATSALGGNDIALDDEGGYMFRYQVKTGLKGTEKREFRG
jgi:sugar lactone lactonase YvrE